MDKQQTLRDPGGQSARVPIARRRNTGSTQNVERAARAHPFGPCRPPVLRPIREQREPAAASILFPPGKRPGIEQLRALAAAQSTFCISFDPQEAPAGPSERPEEYWAEVMAAGLTFDLCGLAPGRSQLPPPSTHRFGLSENQDEMAWEAITVRPAAQLSTGGSLPAVARILASLTAALGALPGSTAVSWHGARALSSPEHFRGSVMRWEMGGAFPGLGLTALAATPSGGLQSEGLSLFTGQEVRLAPEIVRERAAGARLALRLLHWMVERGRLDAPLSIVGPGGEPILLQPSADRRIIQATLR